MSEYKSKEQKASFYNSPAWKRMRKHIKQRDNYECQECKRKGLVRIDTNAYSESAKRKKIELVVHHIKELEHHPDLALEEDNLETICVLCHNKEHGRYFERKADQWEDERW